MQLNYISQFFWKKSTIGYGCLVLLGSVTVAGIAEIEIKGQVFSKWINSISDSIQLRQATPQQTQQEKLVTTEHVLSPFTYIGGEVKKISLQVWPFLKGAFESISLIKTGWKEILGSIWNFISNLIDPQIFNRIFDNIHHKIWNFISFFLSGGEGRTSFINLFKGGKLESTFLAAKFLLGQEIEGNKYFKARPNVFSYLLLNWMDNPNRITGKFDRLSTSIKKLTDKLKKGRGDSSSKSDEGKSDKNVYWLEIPTVKEYLDVKEGMSETIFNTVWMGEVLMKIQTGTDDLTGAKSWASMIGGLFF